MKKKGLSFNYITYAIICQVCLCLAAVFAAPAQAANVDDFYFESYDADYYVSKDADGVAKLRVVETFTPVFPDFNQNKGLCRRISYTNQNGKNRTLRDLNRSTIKITRNGQYEPIYSIDEEDGYYKVCTGTEEYIRGKQTYTFEYTFERVVTEFTENGKTWQELYWDTNGTGWWQSFGSLSVRVHFDDADKIGQAWCYVGRYGKSNQERCLVSSTIDGYSFFTSRLAQGENLTFDIEIDAGTYTIPPAIKNYTMIFVTIIAAVIAGLLLKGPIKKYRATAEMRRYYYDMFVKPEYSPHPKYSLVEMDAIYLGARKDVKVALLLDMVIEKKISLVKTDVKFGRDKWSIIVNQDPADLAEEERLILQILNAGALFAAGDKIELKYHTATSSLVKLGKKFDGVGLHRVKLDQLADSKFTKVMPLGKNSNSTGIGKLIWNIIIVSVFTLIFVSCTLEDYDGSGPVYFDGEEMVGFVPGFTITAFIVTIFFTVTACLYRQTHRFEHITKKGIEASRYLDGLKLYIEMAEKDRLAFLQSVEGADTSDKGIVKLYEKLLPYAALFGVEESWMKELEKYYRIEDIETPDWYQIGGIVAFHDINHTIQAASSYATSSTHFSSSGSSGGGGGGFSGGGGGGGGGGGR